MLLERKAVGGRGEEGEREVTRDLLACSNHFSGARVRAAGPRQGGGGGDGTIRG